MTLRLGRRPDAEGRGPRRLSHLVVRYVRRIARRDVAGRPIGAAVAWRLPTSGRLGRVRMADALTRYGERSFSVDLVLEAQRAYELILFLEPNRVAAYRRMAALQTERERFEDALVTVDAGLTRFPTDGPLHAQRGAVLGEFDRWVEAALHLEQAVATPGAKPKWTRWLAHAFAETGQVDRALALVDRLIETNPDDLVVMNSAAGILTGVGRFEEAAELHQRLAAIDPSVINLIRLSRAERRRGRVDLALTAAEEAVAIDVEDGGSSWLALGQALRGADRLEEAVHAYRQAVARRDHHRWLIELARLLTTLLRREEGDALLDQWIELHPTSGRGLRAVAGYYSGSGRMPRAIELAERLVELRDDARSLVLLADYHRMAGNRARALQILQDAERRDPTEGSTYATRAMVHNELLLHEEVLVDLRRAVMASPERDGWRLTLTDRLLSLHRIDEAWDIMQPLRPRAEEPGPIRDRFRRIHLLRGAALMGLRLLDEETTNPNAVFTAFRDLVDGGCSDDAFAYLTRRLPAVVEERVVEVAGW